MNHTQDWDADDEPVGPPPKLRPVDLPGIPLPESWTSHVLSGVTAAFSAAHFVITAVRAWGHAAVAPCVRSQLEWERQETEITQLKEQLQLLKARFGRQPPRKCPHYRNSERHDILALRAVRGWSIDRTAREMLVGPGSIKTWTKLQQSGELVPPPDPVSKYPDHVVALVQRLKRLAPFLGYQSIADYLLKAGLHISASTVKRMLERPAPAPSDDGARTQDKRDAPADTSNGTNRETVAPDDGTAAPADELTPPVRARRVDHAEPGALWHVDITVVPTLFGVAVAWCPFQLPAVFPFAHQVVGVEDHASRKVLALLPFRKQPTAAEIATTLDVAVERQGHAPRHIISDKGCQFWSGTAGKPTAVYSDWLEEHGVKPRFGAVGQHGSIAIIERFWRTLKECGLRSPVPLRFWRFNEELEIVRHWYNSRRPHSSLAARTPDEKADGAAAPKSRARLEVRPGYPVTAEDIEQGNIWRVAAVHLKVSAFQGRRHLPEVWLDFDAAA